MELNRITLVILALSGVAIIFYALLKRLRKEEKAPPYDPRKDDPILHIRNKLFLEVPVEKILFGYFALVALVYIIKLVMGESLPGIDLTVIYLSGLIFFLVIYKMAMTMGTANKFSPWLLFSMVFSGLIGVTVSLTVDIPLMQLLIETREYNITVHLLGLVLGLGGTIIIDIMFTHFLRNYRISARESVIMHLISQMIILGLILLILSGFALLLPIYEVVLDNPRFMMKMTVVLFIILNGAALNLYVTPKMKKISMKEGEKGRHETLKNVSFALGAISIISWLSAFILAMLKDVFNLKYPVMLTGYFVLMIIGIIGSQLAKKHYENKEANEAG